MVSTLALVDEGYFLPQSLLIVHEEGNPSVYFQGTVTRVGRND